MAQAELLPYHRNGFSATDRQQSIEAMHEHTRTTGERAVYDAEAHAWHVWKYDDVKDIIRRKMPGVDPAGKSTLGPLTETWRLALNPLIIPGFLYLQTIPAVTANANAFGHVHPKIRKATFAAPQGLSLNPEKLRNRWGETIERQVAKAVDRIAQLAMQGSFDFSTEFAQPLAAGVISEVIGDNNPKKTKMHADAQTNILGRIIRNPLDQAQAVYGLCGLNLRMGSLVRERKNDPQVDLASHLILQAEELGLKDAEVVALLMNLMAAGYSTTHGTLVNSQHFLSSAEGRECREAITTIDIARRMANEAIRCFTGLGAWKLNAETDVVLSDKQKRVKTIIPAGSTIIARLDAANQDPDIFFRPNNFELDRQLRGELKHLSFGEGQHACVGEQLAREEIALALLAMRSSPELQNLRVVRQPVYPNDRLFNAPLTLRVAA